MSKNFVSTWLVQKRVLALPLFEGFDYDFTVDWGDGKSDHITSYDDPNAVHIYEINGNYTLTISGKLGLWRSYKVSSCELLAVHHLGDCHWQDLSNAFYGCKMLESYNGAIPKTVKDLSFMFDECESLERVSLSNSHTYNVKNMRHLFSNCKRLKYLDLSSFCTKNTKSMKSMFEGASALNFLDISNFNTSKVESMEKMFKDCHSLESLDLNHFKTYSVESFRNMFTHCNSLLRLNVDFFDTSNANDMDYMFRGCSSLKKLKLYSFDFSGSNIGIFCDVLCKILLPVKNGKLYFHDIPNAISGSIRNTWLESLE
jgi:surface protein